MHLVEHELFDVRWELDHGIAIDLDAKPARSRTWSGLRVRYRPKGSRGRWRTFMLDEPPEGDVSDAAIAAAVQAHARVRPPARRV